MGQEVTPQEGWGSGSRVHTDTRFILCLVGVNFPPLNVCPWLALPSLRLRQADTAPSTPFYFQRECVCGQIPSVNFSESQSYSGQAVLLSRCYQNIIKLFNTHFLYLCQTVEVLMMSELYLAASVSGSWYCSCCHAVITAYWGTWIEWGYC